MTNQEMIKILRERTARAIINYCLDSFGVMGFKHKGKCMPFSEGELSLFLVEQIEDYNRTEYQADNAELAIIDAYSITLNEESTGENVKLNEVRLSDTGKRAINNLFSDMIEQLIERGLV